MIKNFNFIEDSHCHLDLIEKQNINIDDIIHNAKQNNVKILQTICTKISEFDKIYDFTRKYPEVFASIGNHPCNLNEESIVKADQIIKACQKHDKLIGIGETGLDYYHDKSLKEKQTISFKEHISAARQTNLPLIIHCRDADDDMIQILTSEMQKGKFKALMHCFCGSQALATAALDLGIYISISGIVTFKNATNLQEIVKDIPLDKILVETDSPYLAPTPYRGKMNQPAYTRNTAEFIAKLKNIEEEELFRITTENFFNLFTKCKI